MPTQHGLQFCIGGEFAEHLRDRAVRDGAKWFAHVAVERASDVVGHGSVGEEAACGAVAFEDQVDLVVAEPADNGQEAHWDRDAWHLEPDSIVLALEALRPRTSGAIIREAFYGTRRFDDFLRHCDISPSVLSTRLRAMVADGLLEKVPYQAPGARARDEYRLTDKGRSLAPILIALNDFADRWLLEPGESTVTLRHRQCGQRVHATVACEAGHQIATAADIVASPGPAARPAAD